MTKPLDIRHYQHDIQAIVASAFSSLRQCHYVFLRVQKSVLARAWIGAQLGAGVIKSVADLSSQRGHQNVLALSFTYAGLEALGLAETNDLPFASLFKTGMAAGSRAALFGDHPGQWQWSDVDPGSAHAQAAVTQTAQNVAHQVHMMAAWFAPNGSALPAFLSGGALQACGLAHAIGPVSSCPAYMQPDDNGSILSYEAFGFRDGISQPVIRGLRDASADNAARLAAGDLFEDRVVAPGEFLFGHENEYGEIAVGPNLQWPTGGQRDTGTSFGLNGSFMVVRQYRQDVDAFECYENTRNLPAHYETPAVYAPGCPYQKPSLPSAAEKMIGRTRTGAPLLPAHVACPEESAFRYRVDDAAGFACPRGAHVRRSNPRDLLGWDVESGVRASKLHRLLRRGRTWTEQCKGDAECGTNAYRLPENRAQRCGAGLMFIALNADLERQYEFVQQQWLMNQKFGDLYDEADPILSSSTGEARHFSMPATPGGKKLTALPDFTKVIGGGYFFLPGIAALHRIAQGPATVEPCGDPHTTKLP